MTINPACDVAYQHSISVHVLCTRGSYVIKPYAIVCIGIQRTWDTLTEVIRFAFRRCVYTVQGI